MVAHFHSESEQNIPGLLFPLSVQLTPTNYFSVFISRRQTVVCVYAPQVAGDPERGTYKRVHRSRPPSRSFS